MKRQLTRAWMRFSLKRMLTNARKCCRTKKLMLIECKKNGKQKTPLNLYLTLSRSHNGTHGDIFASAHITHITSVVYDDSATVQCIKATNDAAKVYKAFEAAISARRTHSAKQTLANFDTSAGFHAFTQIKCSSIIHSCSIIVLNGAPRGKCGERLQHIVEEKISQALSAAQTHKILQCIGSGGRFCSRYCKQSAFLAIVMAVVKFDSND